MSICWNQNSGRATPRRHSAVRWPMMVTRGIGSSQRTSLRYSGLKRRSNTGAGTTPGSTVPAAPAAVVIATHRVELSNSLAFGGQSVLRQVCSSSVVLVVKFRQLQCRNPTGDALNGAWSAVSDVLPTPADPENIVMFRGSVGPGG